MTTGDVAGGAVAGVEILEITAISADADYRLRKYLYIPIYMLVYTHNGMVIERMGDKLKIESIESIERGCVSNLK